jgi:hypothetical protein
MHQHATARRSDRIRPLSVVGLLALALGSVGAGAITLALLTSSASTGGNAFTVGTIAIGLSPSSALLTMSGMLPGDSTTGTLTVSNGGTGTLRYAVTTAATNPDGKALRDQMTLAIRTKDSNTAGCANFNGTQLYSGTLAAAAVGDPAVGAQAGDRTLAAAASEILCFRATLPSSTSIGYQGAATTATFTFDAEQTVNNP